MDPTKFMLLIILVIALGFCDCSGATQPEPMEVAQTAEDAAEEALQKFPTPDEQYSHIDNHCNVIYRPSVNMPKEVSWSTFHVDIHTETPLLEVGYIEKDGEVICDGFAIVPSLDATKCKFFNHEDMDMTDPFFITNFRTHDVVQIKVRPPEHLIYPGDNTPNVVICPKNVLPEWYIKAKECTSAFICWDQNDNVINQGTFDIP